MSPRTRTATSLSPSEKSIFLIAGIRTGMGSIPSSTIRQAGTTGGRTRRAGAKVGGVPKKTTPPPAHAQRVTKKAERTKYRDMLEAIRNTAAKLKRRGGSRKKTTAANPTATFDAKWG